MDSEYDRKFEEMKKYIPFLESMIKRLESASSSGPNPRQAQLDKIKSLRDLLQDKKKRMKMENLLKCEQVLVNLYAKIDQRETLPGVNKALPSTPPPPSIRKPDLSLVRNKLKNVVEKFKRHEEETLPEIARASEIEEICTSGSKEPALFQRRPNKQSLSPTPSSRSENVQKSNSKRNYTRVLVSPDREPKSWSKSSDKSPDKLYSRRSPHRSPRKSSPSYKKERKKSSSHQLKKKSRDLNITLDVPEESLSSLQTKDIFSRIMTCDVNDADLSTLKIIQSKLISELEKTGASEDITDLILKSYKKKKTKTKKEMEEGELSDSETELIENVYGSLVVVNKDKSTITEVQSSSKKTDKEPRKIQIRLVYNSEKDKSAGTVKHLKEEESDFSDFEVFDKTCTEESLKNVSDPDQSNTNKLSSNKGECSLSTLDKASSSNNDIEKSKNVVSGNNNNDSIMPNIVKPFSIKNDSQKSTVSKSLNKNSTSDSRTQNKDLIALAQEQISEIITIDDEDELNKIDFKTTTTSQIIRKDVSPVPESPSNSIRNKKSNETEVLPFKPNFYKPLADSETVETNSTNNILNKTFDKSDMQKEKSLVQQDKESFNNLTSESVVSTKDPDPKKGSEKPESLKNYNVTEVEDKTDIPFISKESVQPAKAPKSDVSEVDILQALKNEILNEAIPIPSTQHSTPPLHQPKITKVASAQEILNKKRISIEKYKEKTVASTNKPSLFVKTWRYNPEENIIHDEQAKKQKDELSKKQSLKLTEKECERFNLSAKKLDLNESSGEEENNELDSPDIDIYANLAPKSPEVEADPTIQSQPIIIPVEPLKPTVSTKADVDMRTMILPPTSPRIVPFPNVSASASGHDKLKNERKPEPYRPPLVDPRLRVDSSKAVNPDRTPRQHMYPNMTPSRNPNMTPSRNPSVTPSRNPNMTPSTRTCEMTPSHQSFDFEDISSRKHVYAPFPTFDLRDRETSVTRETHKPNWEPTLDKDGHSSWGNIEVLDRNQRATSAHRDNVTDYQRPRSIHNERYSHREEYPNRQDCPRTPVHPFGRSECPSTPTPSFGRMDTPMTPVHPFGRSDCPATPSHPFGRSDIPQQPSHSFGRNECPRTPSHPFGRGECPTTPSHPFGRGECPTTPSHPFGRGECPTTPSHPFGRGECPTTPSHPFGRGECPTTPSHPFGRSDVPIHGYGKKEYGPNNSNISQKHVKDPRLNRSTEYESRNLNTNYNRYQNDGRLIDNKERSRDYNRSDSYHHGREQTIVRNEKTYDGGRSYERGPPIHRDHFRRENDKEQFYTQDRPRYQRDGSTYHDGETKRDYQHASTSNRPSNNRFTRAPSVGRFYREHSNDNKLAVKPQTGHSFTIDTSVNRTFQEFLSKKGIQDTGYTPSFDARRQRAASVGRALLPDPPSVKRSDIRAPSVSRISRESSVGRELIQVRTDSFNDSKRNNYMRARSVGRDMGDVRQEKSFKDIKAEFQSYSKSFKIETKRIYQKVDTKITQPQQRKEVHERSVKTYPKQAPSSTYSPRKNYRDPRMRREHSRDYKYSSPEKRHNKNYGIVYSNDNIARGAILGPGYGVKNYKIPKIKRAEEKPPEEKLKTGHSINSEDKKDDNKKIEKSDKIMKSGKDSKEQVKKSSRDEKPNVVYKKKSDSHSNEKSLSIKKTINQSTKETEASNREVVNKFKKVKKAIISSDSDTDTETKVKTFDLSKNKETSRNVSKELRDTTDKETTRKLKSESENKDDKVIMKETEKENEFEKKSDENINTKTSETDNSQIFTKEIETQHVEEKESDKIQDDLLDSSFGIDDLSMFPDNMESDQVMDNINALIADLDNDDEIEDNKDNEAFSNELNIENMIENINTSISKENLVEETLKDIHELIDDLNKNSTSNKTDMETSMGTEASCLLPINNIPLSTNQDSVSRDNMSSSSEMSTLVPENKNDEDRIPKPDATSEKTSDEIVTTSDNVKKAEILRGTNLSEPRNSSCDRNSTPDSTVTANDSVQDTKLVDSFPDSTNEANPDISSTNIPTEASERNATVSHTETTKQVDSFEYVLSILKDKSKIKKLLTMLDEESEGNNEIKSYLEKISQNEENTADELQKESSKEENVNMKSDIVEKSKEDSIDTKDKTVKQDTEEDKAESPINNSINDDSKSSINKSINDDSDKNKTEPEEQPTDSVKTTVIRRGPKGKRGKKATKVASKARRVTRSGTSSVQNKAPKKPSRELQQLQNDIKEMFISDEVLNATGIRMCRLAKLVYDKNSDDSILRKDANPVVVLEKFQDSELIDASPLEKIKKKPGPKPKSKEPQVEKDVSVAKHKPGPKSKTRPRIEDTEDVFESENIDDKKIHTGFTSSDSDNDSLASTKSFGSSEALIEVKKKMKRKRGRGGWQSGVIRKKKRKVEKNLSKQETSLDDSALIQKDIKIPDMNCFTDKSYCFLKNVSIYSCRLCSYSGNEIVHHYKSNHPHSEIPLSRMSVAVAKEAIEQCDLINFQTISKLPSEKYVCRFCYKEFVAKRKANALEGFFWHVVSTHTGEYKQLCSECVNVTRCPFNLDIPPPPKDIKGQLIGYICGKCNFTQISLENLKTHVIVRHNDEQTAVYTINLASMSKKTIQAALKKQTEKEPRTLRSSRSNHSFAEASDERSDVTESTEQISEFESLKGNSVKDLEHSDIESGSKALSKSKKILTAKNNAKAIEKVKDNTEVPQQSDINLKDSNLSDTNTSESYPSQIVCTSNDVLDYSHFKITYSDTGSKEYVCCINGNDNHYKTTLLISMKKHVQIKHSEKWDGYCSTCKVIVTPQGKHSFKECLQHLLDKHIDDFPLIEKTVEDKRLEEQEQETISETISETMSDTISETKETIFQTVPLEVSTDTSEKPKPYINVRPLSQLLSKDVTPLVHEEVLPQINEVISFGGLDIESVLPSPEPIKKVAVPKVSPNLPVYQPQKYEETQAEIMSQKHQVVLDTMMPHDKLVKIFKCAGKYCYFTSDNLDDSLLHANTHQRIGGENALHCSYCEFDSFGNAITLVTHVFKTHGCCPYVCSKCFYRAVSSQLVKAHAINVHGEEYASNLPILKTDIVTPSNDDERNLIPRDVAVKQYFCANVKDVCTFKTYTQVKFIEHLDRHQPPFICYICSNNLPTPSDLVKHMKSHGLKVLQCTWCIYGADNDEEFLIHASSMHPNKPPQAYFRVITSQEAAKSKVLPLVKYNKTVPIEVVTPSAKDNPVREAERALELENLINLVKDTVDSSESEAQTGTSIQPTVVPSVTQPLATMVTSTIAQETRPETPVSLLAAETMNWAKQTKPLMKNEPVEAPNISEVILLDSDDEDSRDSRLPTIDLSNETVPSKETVPEKQTGDTNLNENTLKKIPFDSLYKCSLCPFNLYKTFTGFKRHINSHSIEKIKCAHCTLEFTQIEELFRHYQEDHRSFESSRDLPERSSRPKSMCESPRIINCSKCTFQHKAATVVKDHMRISHGCKNSNFVTKSRKDDEGNFIYETHAYDGQKPAHKRKLSLGSDLPAKKKRYGPDDVNELPNKPILDDLVYCALCEFNSKVRVNVVRHLQGHADKQPVAQTVPVNPVPHLETNEKHFDKMVNLASSSIVTKAPDKPTRVETIPAVHLTPKESLRYPKYVSDRQRHTCGAKGCSYISVDEDMLKCHWETLHGGCHQFHCVHCPPYQQLDTSRSLTAVRILIHLRMHGPNLYACSSCTYYHYKREILLKHLTDTHKDSAQIVVVREEITPTNVVNNSASSSAPTMDLKPWQCGLCKFKSMLRQEVVEHCYKDHNSKMQFKCPNCPFRTSTFENVAKHLSHSHPKSKEEVLYYYYREGSISDEPDGTPRWMKQRQKLGLTEPEVKAEVDPPRVTTPVSTPMNPPAVNLDIVKKEVEELHLEQTTEQLCKEFGSFCDPNGLKYKCPLCKVFNEDTKEAMQAHLFEELKYRKWGCSICSYKAFHKVGLKDHIQMEHGRVNREPVELPIDAKVEKWVADLLSHQTALIENTKKNFARLQQQLERPCLNQVLASNSASSYNQEPVQTPPENINTEELIQAFGELGASEDMNYCCPKCDFKTKEEGKMRDHLETELNKIRWRCSNCNIKFQDYHEAQLHCRTVHFGQSSRPVEATRDPMKRGAWVNVVLEVQKSSMPEKVGENEQDITPAPAEDSLLVVRYEEDVPTPEEQMRKGLNRPGGSPTPIESKRANRKRPSSQASNTDSDDDNEKLLIDESIGDKKKFHKCPHCNFSTKFKNALLDHKYRHYNLKPYTCGYCSYSCYKGSIQNHHETCHRVLQINFSRTPMPHGPPLVLHLTRSKKLRRNEDTGNTSKTKEPLNIKYPLRIKDPLDINNTSKETEVTCLVCEKSMPESEKADHIHPNQAVQFGKKGEYVLKCRNCLDLFIDLLELNKHYKIRHPYAQLNYDLYRPDEFNKEIFCCGYCDETFKLVVELKTHLSKFHKGSQMNYTVAPCPLSDASNDPPMASGDQVIDLHNTTQKKTEEFHEQKILSKDYTPLTKRVAKKSTTKLPNRTVARKSTTKLPYDVDSDVEEYSYYGTKPTSLDEIENVYTLMPFCNTTMPLPVKKLSEIIRINPTVLIKDIKNE